MEQFIVNISGSAYTENILGEEYRVVPLSMLVEGVLTGSKGPVFYPSQEIHNAAASWNNVPITLDHPSVGNKHIYIRTNPHLLHDFELGFIRNSIFDNKLRAEGCFNVAKCKRLSPELLNRIDSNTPIDLSTGLDADVEPANGLFNGRGFDYIARNHRPDHLAILLNQRGACSQADGCGVLVNSENSGMPAPTMFHDELLTNNISQNQIRDQLDSQLRKSTPVFQDEEGREIRPYITDIYGRFLVYALDDELFKVPYTKKGSKVMLSSDSPQRVIREFTFTPVNNTEENSSMADKSKLVDTVIANSAIWTEEDRDVLSGFSEERLNQLNPAPVANTVAPVVSPEAPPKTPAVADKVVDDSAASVAPIANCGCQEAAPTPAASAPATPVANSLTLEDVMKVPEVAALLTNAARIEANEKERLMAQITVNMDDTQRAGFIEQFGEKSTDDLTAIAFAINNAAQTAQIEMPATQLPKPKYIGASGFVANADSEYVDEPLEPPVVNYAGHETPDQSNNPFM
jgi:hypothetical protein